VADISLSTLNRVRYAGFDFDTHVDDLRARIQVKFAADYNDFALASLGMMLLDVISFGLDTLSFYLDRRATEVYLSTARTRRGVSRLTRQLGYKMGGAVSSSTDLDVSITSDPLAINVPIPEGFQFNGPNDLIYRATEEVIWTPAEQAAGTIKQVPVSEGTLVTETFASDGTPNQVFELRRVPEGKYPAAGTVTCTVDGADFEETDFLDFGATDQFEVAFNDDPPTVRFGDGVIGNIPRANATIIVTYVATSGKGGNVERQSILEETTSLVVAGDTITLSVSNPAKSSGGDDPETLAHAKAFAGRVFNSRRVAITRNDYTALAGSYADPVFGRVAVAQAISSRSSDNDLFLKAQLNAISNALAPEVETIRDALLATSASDTDRVAAGFGTSSILFLMLNELNAGSESISDTVANIGASADVIDANVDTTATSLRGNRGLTFEIASKLDQVQDKVEAYGPSGTGDLTQPQVDDVVAILTTADTDVTTLRAAIDTQLATLSSVKDETDKIGSDASDTQFDATDTYLKIIGDHVTSLVSTIGTNDEGTPASSTGLFLTFNSDLAGVADALDPDLANNAAATVSVAITNIDNHVDGILAADCQANLVTVPILVRDSAGFYTAPSNGLVDSLQTYLTERKEVTQTVRVVSGEDFLIFPVLVVRIGVSQGYSLEQTRTAAETAIDGVLIDRSFGVDLYVSDLVEAIKALEGVVFTNVTISGYKVFGSSTVLTDKLDTEGNLIIEDSEVITKNTGDDISVTPEQTGRGILGLATE
jgi:hypothetical protein